MFEELLDQCIRNFGSAPRRFSIWDRLTYWRVVRPDWLYESPNDELETIFLNLSRLRKEGRVVWGQIIQANNLLFSRGGGDCPGEVVYSLEESASVDPDELGTVATAIESLKHTKPADTELLSIADYLTNEWTRVYGKLVPRSISPTFKCQISTVYFVRKHLPGPAHSLERSLLPLIVSHRSPHVALVLPSRYWPDQLVDWWCGDGPD